MFQSLFTGLIRHVLTIAGTWLTATGIVDPSQATEIVGAIMVLLTDAWAVCEKKKLKE